MGNGDGGRCEGFMHWRQISDVRQNIPRMRGASVQGAWDSELDPLIPVELLRTERSVRGSTGSSPPARSC